MKIKERRARRKFGREFILLTVLLNYYSSGVSHMSITRKYGLSHALLYKWLHRYESEMLSLSAEMSELETYDVTTLNL